MSSNLQYYGIPRKTARALVGALVLAGLCLTLGSLAAPQASIRRYLLVALGAMIAGLALLWIGARHNHLWWMLPCATASIGIAFSLGFKVILPSAGILICSGFVLATVGLGLSLAAGNAHSPEFVFAIDGLVLFIALVIMLSGLGYAFRWISLLFAVIGYGFAIVALYYPVIIIYAVAGLLAVLSLLSAPSPESSLRLLLPSLLILSGLVLLRYSRKQS